MPRTPETVPAPGRELAALGPQRRAKRASRLTAGEGRTEAEDPAVPRFDFCRVRCNAFRLALRHSTPGHTTQERFRFAAVGFAEGTNLTEAHMHGLIYLIGLIVVILAILSFFGLR
jgi:hypothetical protein